MKKKIASGLILTLLLVASFMIAFSLQLSTSAQGTGSSNAPALEWYKTYGGATGNSETYGTGCVIQTSDGGYAVAGWTTSYGANANSYEGRSAWLVKTDSNGNVQWNKTYNGDDFNTVIQTSDGGYAIAGASWNTTRSAFDLFVVKTDAEGNVQWSLTYIPSVSGGSLDWGGAYSIIPTSDGGYVLSGSVRDAPDNPGGNWCGWVVKLTANGQLQWDKSYQLNGLDAGAHDIIQTSDGGYAFAGAVLSSGGNGGKMWLVKIDANGNEQWDQTYLGGGGPTDSANSVVQTSNGGYIVAGVTYSSGTGYSNGVIIKTDSSGNLIWKQTYGIAGENSGVNSMVQTSDGGYLLAGYTNSVGTSTADVWVVKTDSSGNQEWNETFGTANYSEATSVIQTNDEGYAVAGYTNSFGAGNYDFLLVKLASSSSTPTPSPSPTPSPLPTPTLTVNCVSSTSYNSFNVQINGNLAFNGTGISGVPILLSYSADNGASWQSLTTVNTDTNGGFLAQWLGPSASGDYLLNATYSGSATYSSVSTVVNLAVMPFISRNANLAFSVESNATVSALAFNSTSNELSFIVSGPSGSTGYANVYISRTLVSDASAITAYKDGNSISYTLTSTADAWVLQFNFGLSTHQITIYLASKSTVSAISLNFGNWLWVIVVVAVIVVLVAAITAWFKRNKIRVVWNKTEEPHAETESVLFAPKQRRKCGEST